MSIILKGFAILVIGLLVWAILFVLRMAILLLPLAILVLGGYIAYKFIEQKLLT